jgi:hypothetical protein
MEVEVMNVAILIMSLVFGAVDAPTSDDQGMPGVAPPTSDIPLQPELRDALQRHQHRSAANSRGVPASSVRGNLGAGGPQSTTLPSAPTSDSDVDQRYQWQAPTAGPNKSGAAMGVGRSSAGFYQSRYPSSPTHPQPGQAKSYNSQQDAQMLQMRLQAAQQATSPNLQQASKAYAGVQQNTGGVSPYMNLYRTGNNNGTIDNYTTLVRPEIDQRRTNQRFGAELSGLEANSRVQGFHLNQLNRDTQNLQGVKYQQFFMNYGDSYPSFYQNR